MPDHEHDRSADVMIRLDGVTKRYDDGTVAVDALSLDVRRGELLALVGPSGCGKSTTLRMVNRLVEPTAGRIVLDGVDVTHSDPVTLRRGIGYVIQRVGLFPHLTVAQNVATVPQLLGWDERRTRARTHELLELVGLEPATYAARYPQALSGGQQQRVGVARALAADPPVLLMDEPFGAVDPLARERLQSEFRHIQESLHKTVLFVTHDLDEAVRLADRVAVFSGGGVLEQLADPATVLASPANERVAEFVGRDAGIRRLAVTPVLASDLDTPAIVRVGEDAGPAARRLEAAGSAWAVVLDDEDRLRGWVRPGDLAGDGALDAMARTAPEPVAHGASWREAFAALVARDEGWLPVVEQGPEARFLGVVTPAALHRALRRE